MGFRSPFGNGPDNLAPPIPGGMTLAQMQGMAAVPQAVMIPKMVGAGFAPAQTSAPLTQDQTFGPPSPAPQPSSSPAALSPDEQALLGQVDSMSAEEKALLSAAPSSEPSYLSPDHPIFQSAERFRHADGKPEIKDSKGKWQSINMDEQKHLEELHSKVQNGIVQALSGISLGDAVHSGGAAAGATAGMRATAEAGPIAAATGALVGAIVGGQGAEWLKKLTGIKDPEERSQMMDMVVDGVLAGSSGLIHGLATGKLNSSAAQAGAAAATAEGGGLARLQAESLLGDQKAVQAGTGEAIDLRRDQLNPGNAKISADVKNIATSLGPEGDILRNQAIQQRGKWINAYDNLRQKLRIPLEDSGSPTELSSGTDLKNHFTQMTDQLNSVIRQYSAKAYEAAGSKKFDIDPILGVMRNEIDQLAGAPRSLFAKDGAVNNDVRAALHAPPEGLGRLLGNYERLRGLNRVDVSPEGFGRVGQLSISTQPVFAPTAETTPAQGLNAVGTKPVSTDVQMPLFSEGRPATYSPTANADALPPSSASTAGTFDMAQTHPGSAPGALGAEVRTDTGIQPSLPGETTQATVSSSMPPNPAGVGTRGLTLEQIDKERKVFDEFARFDKERKGQARSDSEIAWQRVSGAFRDVFTDGAADVLDKSGDKSSSQWLRGAKQVFNENKEALDGFRKLLAGDPTNAADHLIGKNPPAVVKQLLGLMSDDQRKYLAGGFLDSMGNPNFIDRDASTFGAKAMQSRWNEYDPKVKKMLFQDDEKTVDALLNMGRAIESSKPNVDVNPADIPAVRRFTQFLARRSGTMAFKGGAMMIDKMLASQPKIADYIIASAPEVFDVNPETARAQQRIRRTMAQALSSKTAMAGAQAFPQAARLGVSAALKMGDMKAPEDQVLEDRRAR